MDREQAIEALYQVKGKAEIINGQIVRDAPAGWSHGRAAAAIYRHLYEYEKAGGGGRSVGDNVGFVVNLPNRWSFCPDAAFYTGEPTMKFADGAPIFAAEVRSEGDYGPAAEAAMARKRADYFAAGTQVVWDVDLLGDDVVRVYRATDPEKPTVYRKDEEAEAEPALPGWRMPVREVLE